MDLRNIRAGFFDKRLQYACSLDPVSGFDPGWLVFVPGGAVATFRPPRSRDAGEFFHVLDALSVAGVDGRKHDCPLGNIVQYEEQVTFADDSDLGLVEGRMVFATEDRATIEMEYTGRLRFRGRPLAGLAALAGKTGGADPMAVAGSLDAELRIVPVFSTLDTRYRWLSQYASVGFGKWAANRSERDEFHIKRQIDVYSAL